MPPEAKRHVSVILFDLKMDRKKSTAILDEIIMHKSIMNPKDATRLVLLNCTQSQNQMSYKNIYEVTTEIPYTFDVTNCIADSEIDDCNWLDGIQLGTNILSEYSGRSAIFTKQLILISELDYPLLEENVEKRIRKLIITIKDCGMYLYVIGPETNPSVTICNRMDIKTSMENVKFKNTHCKAEDSQAAISEIVKAVEGVICGPDFGVDFLTYFCNTIPKQAWDVPLTIDKLQFPTTTIRIISPVGYPQVKQEARAEVKWVVPAETADSKNQEIDYSDVVKVYSFMDKIVTLPEDVRDSFKFKGNRMFKLVGFVNSDDIPEVHLEGEEIYRVSVKPDNSKAPMFYQLVKSVYEKKKYGLALRAYNNNNAPKLYILIPKLPGEFTMVLHPEIVTDVCHEQAVKHTTDAVDGKLLNVMSDYLTDLSTQVLPLHPSVTVGIYHKQYLRNVTARIQGKEPTKPIINQSTVKSEKLCALEKMFTVEAVKMEEAKPELHKQEDDDDDW